MLIFSSSGVAPFPRVFGSWSSGAGLFSDARALVVVLVPVLPVRRVGDVWLFSDARALVVVALVPLLLLPVLRRGADAGPAILPFLATA